jgi:hypothetical protein
MKIFTRNDIAARKVLAELRRIAEDERRGKDNSTEDYVFVETYSNCREQGFAIKAHDSAKVAWSECRNSDQIVVYFGKAKDFEFNTNIPSEKSYKNARYFNPDKIEQAARFIFKKLSV